MPMFLSYLMNIIYINSCFFNINISKYMINIVPNTQQNFQLDVPVFNQKPESYFFVNLYRVLVKKLDF